LGAFLLLSFGLAWGTVNAIYTALLWYSSMQQRADELLRESRDNRAELQQTLKSLETADHIRYRMQQELLWLGKQVEEARRMKERFAAHISHELRTPLNLILGFSEVMYMSPETYGDMQWSPTLRRDIYQIYRSSRHLLDMIDDILDLSHFEVTEFSVNLELTNLNDFLEDTIGIARNLFRKPHVHLDAKIEPNLPLLEIDRTRIRQALLNLLNNAQRFTNEGYVRLIVHKTLTEVSFCIEDTGMGIPNDKLAYIFDEFYQVDYSLSRHHGGAGLGLAITKKFVEAHKGKIYVESQEGVGSKFTFVLPLPHQQTQDFSSEIPTIPLSALEELKPAILVVDPDPAVIAMMQRALENYQLIQVDPIEDLAGMMELHRPWTVIKNIQPQHSYHPLNGEAFPMPYIECTLPSRVWMAKRLAVAGCLVKPITRDDLIEEVKKIEGVRRILIIDNDRGFIQLIERLLQTHDSTIEIYHAYEGDDGIALMRTEQPDIVFLDMGMSENSETSENPFQQSVLQKIKQDSGLAKIPIVLLAETPYVEKNLPPCGSSLIIYRAEGLFPDEVLGCLQTAVQQLRHNLDKIMV
jgi:signal transduction histidine kinase